MDGALQVFHLIFFEVGGSAASMRFSGFVVVATLQLLEAISAAMSIVLEFMGASVGEPEVKFPGELASEGMDFLLVVSQLLLEHCDLLLLCPGGPGW